MAVVLDCDVPAIGAMNVVVIVMNFAVAHRVFALDAFRFQQKTRTVFSTIAKVRLSRKWLPVYLSIKRLKNAEYVIFSHTEHASHLRRFR